MTETKTKLRSDRPEYEIVLKKYGFIQPGTLRDRWGLWQSICADPVVRALSDKLEAKKAWQYRSSAGVNSNARKVLARMTPAQRSALKARLGVSQ